MPFILIKGTFHVVGYAPDGDSLKFKANDDENWAKLSGPRTRRNKKGHAQLRFEAVDTLETHYAQIHQPKQWADPATDRMLDFAGIEGVEWNAERKKVLKAKDEVEGYILSRTTERYRRPVAFVFKGDSSLADGSEVHLDEALLKQSLNYQLLLSGDAYPTYYKGLFHDLREVMTLAVLEARSAKKGVWNSDQTAAVEVSSLEILTDEVPILPKLFRRLSTHYRSRGSVEGFKAFLEARREGVLIISKQHFTHYDTVIEVEGDTVRMTVLPEDLVFLD